MLAISSTLLTFCGKTDVGIILIIMTNITYASDIHICITFSVSQCFKHGFDFVYFHEFSVRKGK